jgi:hypothetical protein
MNVTREMLEEAYDIMPASIPAKDARAIVAGILIANAILECHKTLAIIAQKVLDTFP